MGGVFIQTKMFYHQPVMPAMVLKYLNVAADKVYIDCTLGEGGHSEFILKNCDIKLLVGIEQDSELIEIAKKRFKNYKNIIIIQGNFKDLDMLIEKTGIKTADGFLFDLGLSMYHFKKSNKGFSFQQEAPLDMRFSKEDISAEVIVNQYPQKELVNILRNYGEERFAQRIASAIMRARQKTRIQTTTQLAQIIEKAVPRKYWQKRIHPATRTFQALRIAVNNELENLEMGLKKAIERLSPGGRVCVISYHSLEDRIVKNIFKSYEKQGLIKILTKKPITPSAEEINKNRSARSAKLRAAELTHIHPRGGHGW